MKLVRRLAALIAILSLVCAAMFAVEVSKLGRAVSNRQNLLDEPRHPVTDPMWQTARAVAGKPAPNFDLLDPNNKRVVLSQETTKGPVVLVFTKDDCPCSMEAQPFFNQLAEGYADKVTFFGVIDSKAPGASKYQEDFKVPYEMLVSDKDGAIFKAYHAKRSVYTTLIGKDGVVIKQWPGYNRAMFVELDEALAKVTGSKAIQINTDMAPEKMNSGCAFPIGSDE